jgi:hypothetical protein
VGCDATIPTVFENGFSTTARRKERYLFILPAAGNVHKK